jgi:hypothetical protein
MALNSHSQEWRWPCPSVAYCSWWCVYRFPTNLARSPHCKPYCHGNGPPALATPRGATSQSAQTGHACFFRGEKETSRNGPVWAGRCLGDWGCGAGA